MELPAEVPVMTLPTATLFPQALLPLYIFEPRYRRMLADALHTDRMFCVAMQKPGGTRGTPCRVAGLGLIRVSVGHHDGTSHLILQGLTRVHLGPAVRYKPYRVQRVRPLTSPVSDGAAIEALATRVQELVGQRLDLAPFPLPAPMKEANPEPGAMNTFTKAEVLKYLSQLPGADQLADLVTCALLSDASERQTILETVELEPRLRHLVTFLMAEVTRQRNKKAKAKTEQDQPGNEP
jgi:ATP-dependent Lon protease